MSIPKEWLVRSKTKEEFEREALERKASVFNIPLEKVVNRFGDRPFGEMTAKWQEFTARMQPEDDLWFFRTPEKMFVSKMGALGYAIVRDGKIVDTLVMMRT